MNDLFMGALQTVVRDAETDSQSHEERLDLLPNPDALTPRTVAEQLEHGRAPRLASPDISKLAQFAVEQGYHLARFQLVDQHLDLLREPDQSYISNLLVERFVADGIYGLSLALEREFPGVYLNGLELYLPHGVRLDVRRRGVLFSNDQQAALSFMRDAWKEARLR